MALLTSPLAGITATQKACWVMDATALYTSRKSLCILLSNAYMLTRDVFHSPSASVKSPFYMITNDTQSLAQINRAVNYPNLIMLSDWNHFTSPNIRDIAVSANVDPLSV
jgi:hypothetical protein